MMVNTAISFMRNWTQGPSYKQKKYEDHAIT